MGWRFKNDTHDHVGEEISVLREMNLKISRVFRMGQAYMNERAKEYGLSSGLFFYMFELSEQDGLTLQELSQAVGVDNGFTTRMVNRLEGLGIVYKSPNPADSRSSKVFLTERGRELSSVIYDIFLEWKQIVTKDVTEDEILIVNNVFDKFYRNANAAKH